MSMGGVDDYTIDIPTQTATYQGFTPSKPEAPPPAASSPELNLIRSGLPPRQPGYAVSAPNLGVDPNQGNPVVTAAANAPPPPQVANLMAKGLSQDQALFALQHAGVGDFGLGGERAGLRRDENAISAENVAANKDIVKNTQAAIGMAQQKADLDKTRAEAAAAYDVEAAKRMEDHQKQQALDEERAQMAYNDKRSDLSRIVAQASTAHVDPEAARGSLGQRALAGIAIALGALGSARTGQPNYAADIISKQIEDNLQAQKDEIANKWRGVEAGRNDLSDLHQQIGDTRAADNIFRAREAQKRIDYLQSYDTKNMPAQIRANLADSVQKLQAYTDQQLHEGTIKARMHDEETRARSASIAGEQARIAMENQRLDLEKGKTGALPKDLQESEAHRENLLPQIDRILKQSGAGIGTERVRDVQERENALRGDLVKFLGLPERTGMEEVRKNFLPGSVTDLSSKADEQLRSLRKQIIERTNRKRTEYGLPGWAERAAPGKEGAI